MITSIRALPNPPEIDSDEPTHKWEVKIESNEGIFVVVVESLVAMPFAGVTVTQCSHLSLMADMLSLLVRYFDRMSRDREAKQ